MCITLYAALMQRQQPPNWVENGTEALQESLTVSVLFSVID